MIDIDAFCQEALVCIMDAACLETKLYQLAKQLYGPDCDPRIIETLIQSDRPGNIASGLVEAACELRPLQTA